MIDRWGQAVRRLSHFAALLGPLWRIARACAASAILISIGSFVLLAITLTFSSDVRIEASLREAVAKGLLTRENFPLSPYGHTHHAYDMPTECAALTVNLSNGEEGLLRRIVLSPRMHSCRTLVDNLEMGGPKAYVTYLRFWHGYQVYMRPMLTITSLENMRRVTALIFYGVLVFFASQLALWFGLLAAPVALIPFFIIGDFLTVPVLTAHAISLSAVFLSAALVPAILKRFENARTFILPTYVFSAGMVINYVSFLLNPPLAPALIGFLVIAHDPGRYPRQTLQNTLYAFGLIALWFAGYVVEWFAKWALAATTLGFQVAYSDIAGHLSAYQIRLEEINPKFLDATSLNLYQYNLRVYIYLSLGVSAGIIGIALLRRRITKQEIIQFLAMLAPLAVVVAWVEINAFHSIVHCGFVYRSFLLFVVVPPLAAILILRRAASN